MGSSQSSAQSHCQLPQPDWASIASRSEELIDPAEFYEEYHGHKLEDLVHLRNLLMLKAGCRRFVYFLGDSSLDNKHWLFESEVSKKECFEKDAARPKSRRRFVADALNGFDLVLMGSRNRKPCMVQDVAYWLNKRAFDKLGEADLCTLMTSVEESTIADRDEQLFAQDIFIRDHITENDFLVVSVGGNDVALRPKIRTIISMMMLVNSPMWMIRNRSAPGFWYFFDLFHGKIEALIKRVIIKRKPKKVLVCMLYFLDVVPGGSWADSTLASLGYDNNPAKLQLVIRTLYQAIKEKGFDVGAEVEPFPLFEVLDGEDTRDYCQRVEPSVQGGGKIGYALFDALAGC